MVEIGASSRDDNSISKSPAPRIRGSNIPSPSDTGNERVNARRVLILDFNSAAAFLVKVIATTSLGSNPCQSFNSVLSLAGALNEP